MENNYYLSIGTKLGGHYEIEKVLNEDEYEIIYLAKDLHKRGEYVILKELFLKAYSSRDGADVSTVAKSKIIFEETKKEIKKEVDGFLENPSTNQVSIYGTFEENNTIYTIMEFVNNSNLDAYLKVNTTDDTPEMSKKDVMQEEIIEPSTKKTLPRKEEKKEKSSIFLKILITMLLICLALGYYAYNMIKDDKTKTKEKTTSTTTTMTSTMVKEDPKQERTNLPISKEDLINDYKEESQNREKNQKERTTKIIPKGAAYVTDVDAFKKEQEIKRAKEEAEKKAFEEKEEKLREREEALRKKEEKLREDEENALEDEEERLREEEEKKLQDIARKEAAKKDESKKNEQSTKEFVPDNIGEFMGEDNEPSNHPENDVPSPFKDAEENLPLGAVNPNTVETKIGSKNKNSLGKRIGEGYVKTQRPKTINKQAIKQFLNNFIRISGDGSIDEILSNYDDDVERYFSLRNVNHDTIRRDKTNYHRKWSHRKFKLLNFDVTKIYKNGDETFYDIKTTTNWSVSNDEGKSIAGTSNGVMTLRKTDNGFKVTSIYTNKSK